ncbi:hypothetical protein [Nocardia goodfellowii]|uniref:Uncharacterized protein n=1 Tax=Nocardia goodfellowii TaxID=882446 RepID=A0ABS4QS49_9NOCA|nr:hypothetical protein [Nocardia goodfellowii]MBP2194542.1 hypothetical protein [Nocardia goodfellowii]
MTTTEESPAYRDEYAWGLAPPGLKTRRQLRAMGKSPGRSVVALMVGKFRGRRVVARLFDPQQAPAKRVPSPAQLAAIRKATHEHQLRAAERRGVSREELTTVGDPGPTWDHNPEKEGNTMSDNTTQHAATHTDPGLETLHLYANQLERALFQAHDEAAHTDHDLEGIHAYAHQLEDALFQAHNEAATWTQIAEDGTTVETEPDPAAQEKVARHEEMLDEHLRQHRAVLASEGRWRSYYEAIDRNPEPAAAEPPQPQGLGQRMAYLCAVVATNQARDRDTWIAERAEEASAAGLDAMDKLLAETQQRQTRAEYALQATPADNQWARVGALADALLWQQSSTIAAEHLEELTRSYAEEWGVLIDAETLTVSLDPNFDAIEAQNKVEAWRLWDREANVLNAIEIMPLTGPAKATVMKAIETWRGQVDSDNPRAHLDDEATRREQLTLDLAEAGIGASDRQHIEFVVDYLRGRTEGHDLLDTRAMVDPGIETRGRVPRLLEMFATTPKSAPILTEEISVMSPVDQDRVRQVGKEIARGQGVSFRVWPDHIDRYGISAKLMDYMAEVDELRSAAGQLAESEPDSNQQLGVGDEIEQHIDHLAREREELRKTLRGGKGLIPEERVQVLATLEDIDAGRIWGGGEMPELLFADERSKADRDKTRYEDIASEFATAQHEALDEAITATGAVKRNSREAGELGMARLAINATLYTVASGVGGKAAEIERGHYAKRRARFVRALTSAGVDEQDATRIRGMVDDQAREAGKLGQAAGSRAQQWQEKTTRLVATRNDVAAQHRAAASGRAARPERTVGRDQAALRTEAPAHAQVRARATSRRRQLESPEVGR